MQALLRKANLVSQMTIERKEKELLFEGGTEVRRRLAVWMLTVIRGDSMLGQGGHVPPDSLVAPRFKS